MKNVKYISYACILILFAFTLSAQKKGDKTGTLEIKGVVKLNNEKTSDYSVSIYLDGRKADSIYIKSTKSINFYVQYNQLYTVHFQKKNCVDKFIIINTQIPNCIKAIQDNIFQFETELNQSLAENSNIQNENSVTTLYIDKNEDMLKAASECNKNLYIK